MGKSKRQGRSLSDLKRKSGKKESGKVVLIVCEGKTEKVYFDALRNHYRLAEVADIQVTDESGTDPISIVNCAIDLAQKRKREAKRSTFSLPYDEIWCIIDVENPAHNLTFPHAVNKADNSPEKIRLAVSNPAFEYWFVLHFEHTSRPFADGQEVKSYLKKHIPDYEEGQDVFPDLLAQLDTAVERAERVLQNYPDDDRYPNPSTLVFCLVQQLRHMASHSTEKATASCQKAFPE